MNHRIANLAQKVLSSFILGSLIILSPDTAAHAAPPLPASIYGAAQLNGAAVPPGTLVSAWVNGVKLAESAAFVDGGFSVFLLDVPGDDPATVAIEGGAPGAVIRFTIDNIPAIPTTLWRGGANRRLDLASTQRRRQPPDDAGQLCTHRNSLHGPSQRGADNGRGNRQAVEDLGKM